MVNTTMMSKRNWANVIILGAGFMLLFTAFQTSAFVQGVTIDSFLSPTCAKSVHNNGSGKPYIIDGGIHITEAFSQRIGYISLCIIYLMVALGNWVSVPIVTVFGAKWSCVISAALYVVYLVALVRPYVPVIFLGAFVLGSAGGILWTAQGQILIQNSSKSQMGMTSGIFWLMLQTSLIVGNLFFFIYLFFRVEGKTCIPKVDNYIIFGIFSLLGVIGVACLVFIKPMSKKETEYDTMDSSSSSGSIGTGPANPLIGKGTGVRPSTYAVFYKTSEDAWMSIVGAAKLMISPDMLLLTVTFIYTGYELNFWSGVYGTVIGHTLVFKRAEVGLAGLFIGLGEIVGGGLFGILGKYTNKFGKDPVVLLGMLVHFIAFYLAYANLPALSIADKVSAHDSLGAIFNPSNIYIAMTCAFLLGFGDACFNTQIYAIIGTLYPLDKDSAPAMALFKFFQSLAAMIGFVTTNFVHLKWQLLVLVVLATLGTLSFAVVEWKHYKPPNYKKPKYSVNT